MRKGPRHVISVAVWLKSETTIYHGGYLRTLYMLNITILTRWL